TLRSEVERIWALGRHVIFDIDAEGGLHLKRKFADRALAIFVQPPSLEALVQRLRGRGPDGGDKLAERIAKAEKELRYADQFDVILCNDDLDRACLEAEQLMLNFISEKER